MAAPLGNKYALGNAGGRKSEYREEYCGKVDEYLAENQDEYEEFVRQKNEGKGYEMLDKKLKVRLPTIEGFANFINVPKRTLYEWRDKYEEFSHSLEKIVDEQKKRLLNMGLSGDYNSTIAKLILSVNHGMHERTALGVDGGDDGKPLEISIVSQINKIYGNKSDRSDDTNGEEGGSSEGSG